MTIYTITKILKNHGIFYTVGARGIVWAQEVWTDADGCHQRMVNVTRWTAQQLFDWLGY